MLHLCDKQYRNRRIDAKAEDIADIGLMRQGNTAHCKAYTQAEKSFLEGKESKEHNRCDIKIFSVSAF